MIYRKETPLVKPILLGHMLGNQDLVSVAAEKWFPSGLLTLEDENILGPVMAGKLASPKFLAFFILRSRR
jgi:hypothetical protein